MDSIVELMLAADDDYKNDPDFFETLLEDAQKHLYPGCRNFTKLHTLVKLYNLKAWYGWSDKSFSKLLGIVGDMLPLNNELPLSMCEEKRHWMHWEWNLRKYMLVQMIAYCIGMIWRMHTHVQLVELHDGS